MSTTMELIQLPLFFEPGSRLFLSSDRPLLDSLRSQTDSPRHIPAICNIPLRLDMHYIAEQDHVAQFSSLHGVTSRSFSGNVQLLHMEPQERIYIIIFYSHEFLIRARKLKVV